MGARGHNDILSSLSQRLSRLEERMDVRPSLRVEMRGYPTPDTGDMEPSRLPAGSQILQPPSVDTSTTSPATPFDISSQLLLRNDPTASTSDTSPWSHARHISQDVDSTDWTHVQPCPQKFGLSCEELRPPLPDVLSLYEVPRGDEILPLVQSFFKDVCPLYPIICDKITYEMATAIVTRGLSQDLMSCLILLVIALGKAHAKSAQLTDGLPEFQKGIEILSRITVQFTLEYVQACILSALFMLRKGRLFDFWQYLHGGCTNLYTMIHRCVHWRHDRRCCSHMFLVTKFGV